jgi:hypothetical protein
VVEVERIEDSKDCGVAICADGIVGVVLASCDGCISAGIKRDRYSIRSRGAAIVGTARDILEVY